MGCEVLETELEGSNINKKIDDFSVSFPPPSRFFAARTFSLSKCCGNKFDVWSRFLFVSFRIKLASASVKSIMKVDIPQRRFLDVHHSLHRI